MNRRDAEHIVYRTGTIEQLVAALIESRDHTDIRRIFGHHEGGSRGFEIACRRLGIPKKDWGYANNVVGFLALIGILGDNLKLSKHEPAPLKTRLKKTVMSMKPSRET